MFEAREFLRKKLIGQNVQITVDYIQPANTSATGGEFPEKTCCTVTIGKKKKYLDLDGFILGVPGVDSVLVD